LAPIVDDPGPEKPELVSTPGQKTIEEVSQFLKIHPWQQIKTLVYVPRKGPVLVLVRGDHQLNETKLQSALGSEVRPAHPVEIEAALGASAGSLGPVGVSKLRILSDPALQDRSGLTCGANRDDYHLSGVTPGRDYQAEYFDLRLIQAGEPCVQCGKSLSISKALEVGHIFKLGTKYSQSLGANVLTSEGKPVPIVMGSYGIGLERILAAAIEGSHDADGICWPLSIAPFQCVISVLSSKEDNLVKAAERVYEDLQARGIDVLFDDRDERPGVKFKDADLIGIPYRINFGSKKFKEGKVEWVERASRKSEDIPLDQVIAKANELLRN
jgi:prolyl-tRNA synthetase